MTHGVDGPMVDAHCHLASPRMPWNVNTVLRRARAQGVEHVVSAGFDPAGWRRQRAIARDNPGVHTLYGLHPWAVNAFTPQEVEDALMTLETLVLEDADVCGLGEIGLDRCTPELKRSIDAQLEAFQAQLRLACRHNLPVSLHVVQSHHLALDLLRETGLPARGGLVHGFSGSPEVAMAYVRLGLCISFGGRVTCDNAKKARAAVKVVPDQSLLVETDAPDQTPMPLRPGNNEPANLPWVVGTVAGLRGVAANDVARVTTRNAARLFAFSV